jgi:phosphoenolpyruvate synthase/pyruvate phosphate dikinase
VSGYIAWLDSEAALDSSQVGGKAASLARLRAGGFPVPPGFAVTVRAYRQFHQGLGLDALLGPLEEMPERPTFAQVKDACGPIIDRLNGNRLPGEVESAIREAYADLEGRAAHAATFAVRSSGVSEDGAQASFAGLYESYLNLRGADPVVERVRDCYRCLWHPRAAHYRAIKQLGHRREAMGVVVMETVRSHVSGVAFTLNPITGATDEVMINASWGLGEAVVAGLVTPDSFLVGKDGAVRRQDISEKELEVVAVDGGTEQREVPPGRRKSPTLDTSQVQLVTETARQVEERYGRPMDIEFAFDVEGRFFVLQARPITT